MHCLVKVCVFLWYFRGRKGNGEQGGNGEYVFSTLTINVEPQ